MTAFTSKVDGGNWSASGQTTWNEVGVPGTGDTVTLSHNVTVDVDTIIGSDPGTGGTAAITFSSGVAGKTLTIAAGKTLTLRGDFVFGASGTSGINRLSMAAGSTLSFKPGSGQKYKFNFASNNSGISCAGSSGSHCTVKTDTSLGGLPAWMNQIAYRSCGMETVTYTDFIDMGDTTNWGVSATRDYTALSDFSMTNCTFTRCNFNFNGGANAWDGNATFQRNIFTSSISISLFGGVLPDSCCKFEFSNTNTSGVRLVDLNAFDKNVYFDWKVASGASGITNNVFSRLIAFGSSSIWVTAAQFSGNFLYTATDGALWTIYGPSTGNYWAHGDPTNPHYVGYPTSLTAMTFASEIFEGASTTNDGVGDIILPPGFTTGTPTLSVKNCVVVASKTSEEPAGQLGGLNGALRVQCTFEHNTMWTKNGSAVFILLNETAAAYAGQVTSCKSNLLVSKTAGTYLINDLLTITSAVDAVTASDYNAVANPSTGTCYYNSSTSQAGVSAYKGIRVSVNDDYPNTSVGTHDITLASNPLVDYTRNLATWGATQGSDGSYSGAITVLLANPALISTATTGLLAWVRAGYAPTNSLLRNAGHDSVTIGAVEGRFFNSSWARNSNVLIRTY
jgi:hypothetical protein